ncbi:hypothetical protein [Kitasatospora sp. A2-31]|nr:hypothetical protein [Kitasatospora sp. A2-31]MCG6499857.1 hypothetical protein [Kitasatospora sp. A2-31]MCG6499927.1 hypothetical protein [Kitasatospora sp. A2-31]
MDGDDAVRAVTAALEGGRAGQAYNIADDTPLGVGAHVRPAADAFDAPPR